MKKIILIRHGKSAWDEPHLLDYQRPLGERGFRDLPIMAKRLVEKNCVPDLIISSSAKRSAQTTEIIAKELAYNTDKIIFADQLYHASAKTILQVLKTQNNKLNVIFVVGHNPGMTDFIQLMGQNLDNLPTSGQFGFNLNSDSWKDLNKNNVSKWFIDYPKKP